MQELATNDDRAEMPVPDDARGFIIELPGSSKLETSELPNTEDLAVEDSADVVCGVAELPADVPVELPAEERLPNASIDPV